MHLHEEQKVPGVLGSSPRTATPRARAPAATPAGPLSKRDPDDSRLLAQAQTLLEGQAEQIGDALSLVVLQVAPAT